MTTAKTPDLWNGYRPGDRVRNTHQPNVVGTVVGITGFVQRNALVRVHWDNLDPRYVYGYMARDLIPA